MSDIYTLLAYEQKKSERHIHEGEKKRKENGGGGGEEEQIAKVRKGRWAEGCTHV